MSSNLQVRAPKLVLLITLALLGLFDSKAHRSAAPAEDRIVALSSDLWPLAQHKSHHGNKAMSHARVKARKPNKGCAQANKLSPSDGTLTSDVQAIIVPTGKHLKNLDVAVAPNRTDSANPAGSDVPCNDGDAHGAVSYDDMLCLLGLGGTQVDPAVSLPAQDSLSVIQVTSSAISCPLAGSVTNPVPPTSNLAATPIPEPHDAMAAIVPAPVAATPPSTAVDQAQAQAQDANESHAPQSCPCTARHALRLCSPRDADPTISKRFSRHNNIFASTVAFIESHGGLPAELPEAFVFEDVFPLVRTQPNTYTPESVVMSWPNGFDRATGVCLTRYHAEGRYIDAANELYGKLNSREPGYTPECLPVIPHIDEVTTITVLNGFALWLQLATLSATTVSPAVAWRVCQFVADAQRQRKQSRTISRTLRLVDIVPCPPRCETVLAPHCTACGKREVAHDHLSATGRDLLEFIGHAEALEHGAAVATPAPVARSTPTAPVKVAKPATPVPVVEPAMQDASVTHVATPSSHAAAAAPAQVPAQAPAVAATKPDASACAAESTPNRPVMCKIGTWWRRAFGVGV